MAPISGRHLVAHGRALWKLTAPWTHRTRPPRLGKRYDVFHKLPQGRFHQITNEKPRKDPKIALGNPDRPRLWDGDQVPLASPFKVQAYQPYWTF